MGAHSLTDPSQTPNTREHCAADRRRVLTSVVERETTLTHSQGPQFVAKWESRWDGHDNQEVGLEAAIL